MGIQTGIWFGDFKASSLIYLTVLSALFVAVSYALWLLFAAINQLRGTSRPYEIPTFIMGSMAVCMLVMAVIYAFVLAPSSSLGKSSVAVVGNILLHQIVPLLVVTDWFAHQSYKSLRWYHPFLWIALPLTYLVYLFMRLGYIPAFDVVNSYSGTVPYYFLNVDRFGWAYVFGWISAILIAMVVTGYLLLGSKKLIKH